MGIDSTGRRIATLDKSLRGVYLVRLKLAKPAALILHFRDELYEKDDPINNY